ncbi:MAG: hypothetical protein OEM82_09620 [Acidobacteriota bacterium]|nr:hypothetical protein [Acidobacteriota bacterium]
MVQAKKFTAPVFAGAVFSFYKREDEQNGYGMVVGPVNVSGKADI